MITETNIVKIGGTFYMRLPPHLATQHLGIDENSKIFIKDEEKSKGKFISAWKKED